MLDSFVRQPYMLLALVLLGVLRTFENIWEDVAGSDIVSSSSQSSEGVYKKLADSYNEAIATDLLAPKS